MWCPMHFVNVIWFALKLKHAERISVTVAQAEEIG